MATLPNMGLVTPTLGGDEGTWDTLLNTALGLVDAHDHTSGKGVKVTPSGLNISADLTFAGNAATNVGKVAFTAVTALASGSITLFVSSSDNELYWRTNAGTNVKLTDGTSINTSLVGGIVGDYTASDAEVAYDDANERFTFKDTDTEWVRLASGPVRIYQHGTTETVYVGLNAPAGLASSYDITFPTAAPGATAIVQMSSTGVLTASNAVATITPTTIAGTPNFSGAVTMASTLAVTGTHAATGLITATAGVTAAADAHITVSGTGKFKHGDRLLTVPVFLGTTVVVAGTVTANTTGVPGIAIGVSADVYIPIYGLTSDMTVRSVIVYLDSTQADNVSYELTYYDAVSELFVATAYLTNVTTQTATMTTGDDIIIDQLDRTLWVHVETPAGADCNVLTIGVTYDSR